MTKKIEKPTVDQRFIVKLQGKEFVRYEGLLDTAHQIGIKSIETELLQIPNKENGNIAIAKAVVTTEDGKVFEGYGDASPNSVTGMLVPHIIRMAETRAKARALRDLTNIGMTALEELGGEDSHQPKQQVRQVQQAPRQQGNGQAYKCRGCGAGISDKVYSFSLNKYKKPLCMDCQGKVK